MIAPLRAEHSVEFDYRRSVGGATERFLVGLARRELWGVRVADGRVVVPPVDHDPELGVAVADYVRVSDVGTVRSWTWVGTPGPEHPLRHPFAFALIMLDGADTALLHVVDVAAERDLLTGMRVRADWRANRSGSIADIRAFIPEQDSTWSEPEPEPEPEPERGTLSDPIEVPYDVCLEYHYEPGLVLSGFLRALGEGRIEGGRCACTKVYVPPRPRCPMCGAGPMTPLAVEDVGTVMSYTIVHIPVHGALVPVPFAWAYIRLDGTDVPFAHLLGDVAVDGIHVGQRVQAVWAAADELAPTWESIRHFAPVNP